VFVPVQNMTKKEVAGLLARAKVYIDFGHHPGKDRIPREAVMAGCCVVTGRRGSARFDADVPLSSEFKLDEFDPQFTSRFRAVVFRVFADHSGCSDLQNDYRAMVRGERADFVSQMQSYFGRLGCLPSRSE
jgi:hypothetical protein